MKTKTTKKKTRKYNVMKPNQRKEEKKNTNIICYSSFFSSFFGSVHGCSTVGPRRKSNSIFLRQP